MSGAPSVPGSGTGRKGWNHGQGLGGKPMAYPGKSRINHGEGKVKGKTKTGTKQ